MIRVNKDSYFSKIEKKYKNKGEIKMGVSMGVIKTLDVKASKQLREDSKKGALKADTIKKCKELARSIITR